MALLNGFCKEDYPNGDSYEGLFKRGKRHGRGTYYCADGAHYAGEFQDGCYEGTGTYYYSGNEVYEGEWHASQRHGTGTFKYHDGTVYEGRWEAGLRHGSGLMRYADGAVFNGMWANDKRHGHGQTKFADGSSYQGSWADDKRHGFGSLKLPNGSTYDGEFVADITEGNGSMYDANELSSYVGQFRNGLRAGDGRCDYLSTGDRFVGEWGEGSRLQGVMLLASGEVERVGFLNDTLIRREKLSEVEQHQLREKHGEKASARTAKATDATVPATKPAVARGPSEAVRA